MKKYQSDPHFQQKKRDYIIRRYSTDPNFKIRQKQYLVQRYNTDADFQSRQKKYMGQKYREDHVRERKRAYIRTKYASDPNYRHKKKKNQFMPGITMTHNSDCTIYSAVPSTRDTKWLPLHLSPFIKSCVHRE